ncbi:hypothetical protein SAMN05414137_11668 [Streptacidiphilus jiangxiensis]|uniref:Uncharacterized protein n=1 Tax=Streptacidiphilus jiangxiensis TaxID=235985 RepID=A0A1H7UQ19_STRJI|nr:hypothetical protein SAMN05414137_11668 [Streptacidiphilus jiangxiensis]
MSSSACISWAITGNQFPPAEAGSIIARGNRTELVLPRRTIWCSVCGTARSAAPFRAGRKGAAGTRSRHYSCRKVSVKLVPLEPSALVWASVTPPELGSSADGLNEPSDLPLTVAELKLSVPKLG